MSKIHLENVYAVEFLQYFDQSNRIVDQNSEVLKGTGSINLGKETTLIKESDLQKYAKYGRGYRSIALVGTLLCDEDSNH